MSATASTPAPAAPENTVSSSTTSTVNRVGQDWSWMIHHLVLVSVLALFVAGGVYGVLDIIARHDVARETKDSAALALIVKQSADLSTKLANDEAQSAADRVIAAARDAQQTAVIQTLAKTIQARDAALTVALKQNATLSAQQAADKLALQTKAAPGEITVLGDNVTMDLPITRSVLNMGDNLIAAQGDLKDVRGQLVATNVKLTDALANDASAQKDLGDAKALIASKDGELKGSAKVCSDQISTLKAKERKRLIVVAVLAYLGGILTNPLKGL